MSDNPGDRGVERLELPTSSLFGLRPPGRPNERPNTSFSDRFIMIDL